ncbi:nicotinate-nucleotide adenylyltransferase [Candidatus Omnitrophota bacterium]
MRIGLLGGAFNPIHNGHLNIAQGAFTQLILDKVVFIPTFISVHKPTDKLIDPQHRLNMIRLAIEGKPEFEISRFEIDETGPSYAIKTVEYFKNSLSEDADIFFLIGSDSLCELSAWKSIDRLATLCQFVVAHRPGYELKKDRFNVSELNIESLDIASSEIRVKIENGDSVNGLLPQGVEDYIRNKNLYK